MSWKQIAMAAWVAAAGTGLSACSLFSKCGPSSCAGCCDPTGACQPSANDHCGATGNACATCIGLQVCQMGACGVPGEGGGGGGSGSGSGSGSSGSSGSTGASGTSGSTGTTGTSTTSTTGSMGSSGTTGSCAVLGTSCTNATCCAGLQCSSGICVQQGGTTGGGCSPACNFGEKCASGACVCDPSTCTGGYSCNGADRCIQGQCTQGNQACQSFSDCCSGMCSNQVCTVCSNAGGSCNGGSGCCVGLTCYNQTCGSCQLDNTSCTLASQCCSNICNQGTCKACGRKSAACSVNAECCSGLSCAAGSCQMPGETCASALPIALGQTVSGDTTQAMNDYNSQNVSCNGGMAAMGGDLVYRFVPSVAGSYAITLASLSPGYAPEVYVLSTCPSSGSQVACVDGAANCSGGVVNLAVTLNAGATYDVVVDGCNSTNGPFTLTVSRSTSTDGGTGTSDGGTPDAGIGDGGTSARNDTCASPLTITAGQSVSGDTTSATNDYDPGQGGCTSYAETGPDLVYAFTPSSSGTYTVTATPSSSTYDIAVYAMGTCVASGSPISCIAGADRGSAGVTESFTLSATGGTTYFIVVDGFVGSTNSYGPFTLSVQ